MVQLVQSLQCGTSGLHSGYTNQQSHRSAFLKVSRLPGWQHMVILALCSVHVNTYPPNLSFSKLCCSEVFAMSCHVIQTCHTKL